MNNSRPSVTRRVFLAWAGAVAGARFYPVFGAESAGVEPQPYFAGVNRAFEALAKLGAPVVAADAQKIAALARQNDSAAIDAAEKILDRYTLTRVAVEADGYARATAGGAQRTLVEQGWRLFLVRVSNPVGTDDKLSLLHMGNMGGVFLFRSAGAARAAVPDTLTMAPYLAEDWLASQLYESVPMAPALSGFAIEYRVIQLYSRDRGRHSADFNFLTTSDRLAGLAAKWQYRRGVSLDFDCLPSRDVALRVRDVNGRGCVASLTIKDKFDHVYPSQAMRLAPDMSFQPQVYRADGETVRLPDGEYIIESTRGPEYLRGMQAVTISEGRSEIELQLQRWIDPSQWGWYSGDTHIHPAGCRHYEYPTEGVAPETIIRQVRGEGLSVGDILIWGLGWYYQRQFFTGHTESPTATLEHPELQAANHTSLQPHATPEDSESLLRYDVEVSGFPSSHAGHLVLLRLKEQDYPGTKIIEDWPSWNLPILRWARAQDGVAGYAHCGEGMVVDSTDLPNYAIPPMEGDGANEVIVDVTHGLVDFLSGCDGLPVAELNTWYHILNCGFRPSMVGETDWPCISDERPGVGRTYVRLDHRPMDDAGYEAWARGLQQGRLYCGDGRSHFLDFQVNGHRSGEDDLAIKAPETLNIEALVAARLEPEPPADVQAIKRTPLNGWHLENARIGRTREVAVELVVNGLAIDRTTLISDGMPRSIKFKTPIARSSWVALRILPSAHTNPVFVQVSGKPIRAWRRSAQWCRACVDKVWEVKSPFIRESERATAAEAFDHARKTYEKIIGECEVV